MKMTIQDVRSYSLHAALNHYFDNHGDKADWPPTDEMALDMLRDGHLDSMEYWLQPKKPYITLSARQLYVEVGEMAVALVDAMMWAEKFNLAEEA